MKNITVEQVKAAKKEVASWLETRQETLENLRHLDPANDLIELAELMLSNAEANSGALEFRLTEGQIDVLIENASSKRKAWDLLSQYASKNPTDERLKPFISRRMNNEKPPSKARGRKPNVFRDYFICVALAKLIDAGLNIPSSKITRAQFNAAHVLAEILLEMKPKPIIVLSPETIIEIWQQRDNTYEKALAGAGVITGNNSGG